MHSACLEKQAEFFAIKKWKGGIAVKKDILIVFAAVLLVAGLIMGTNFQTVDEYYLTHIDDITETSETVTISIDCSAVLDHYDKLDPALRSAEFVPQDGVILAKTQYVLRSGDTVYDLLDRAVRYNQIQFEYQGADKNIFGSVYVKGIHYLYEFSCGPTSGWVYRVNGEFPNYGCSRYRPKDGDVIEWLYTCDLGSDSGYGLNNAGGEAA